MENQTEVNLFERGRVQTTYVKLALPLVCSLVVTVVYNIADTYFISWTQNTDLVAGVSLCVPILTILMALGNIFGQGGSSMISRLLGQSDRNSTRQVSSFCFYASLLFGVGAGVLMFLLRTPILHLLGADADTFLYAGSYYNILCIGAPFIVANYVHSNLLRSEGHTKISMAGSIGGVVLNIILDPILITVLGWGARGAAIASVLGYLFCDIFFVAAVHRMSRNMSLNPMEMRVSGPFAKQIFGIGISAALSNIMQSFSLILTNQFLLSYGNDKIAAMGIAQKAAMIVLLVLTGFAFGGQPIISYFYGAKNREKLRELLRFAFRFMIILAAVMTVILEIAAPLIIRGFLKDPDIVATGTAMFRWQVITMVFVAISLLITIIFQATGKVAGALVLSVCRQGIIFFFVLWIASALIGYTGIVAAQAGADAITAVVALILYRRRVAKKELQT